MPRPQRPPNLLQSLSQWLDTALFGGVGTAARTRLQMGHAAEDLAAGYLKAKGYEIVERNVRCGRGELDIVARQAGVLVVVEVKSGRADDAFAPREKVDRAKQRQLVKLTEEYRKQRRLLGQSVRIDVVEVVFDARDKPQLEHFENAVRDSR